MDPNTIDRSGLPLDQGNPAKIREWSQIRAQQIVDKMSTEKRDMTPAEKLEFESCLATIRKFNGKPAGDRGDTVRAKAGDDFAVIQPGESVRSWAETHDKRTDFDDPAQRDATLGDAAVGLIRGERRAQQMGDDSKGGFMLTESISSSFIDRLRNRLVVSRAGSPTIAFEVPGADSLSFANLESDATAYWRPETVEITESTLTFGKITARPKVVSAFCRISEELALHARNAPEIINRSLSEALALEIDRAALLGVGAAGEPTGVINWPGIQSTTGDDSTTADSLIDWANAIAVQNGPKMDQLSMLTTPTHLNRIRKQKDGAGLYLAPNMPEEFRRMRKFATNQLRDDRPSTSNRSEILFGNFGELALITRLRIRIDVGHIDTDFQKLQFSVRAWAMVDTAVFQPKVFHHVDNLL